MEWWEIVFELLDDPMIQSCGCDGLLDAYNTLKGLLGMCEIMPNDLFDNNFILTALNASINARNNYCALNGAEKLKPVKIIDSEFVFDDGS